MNEKIYIPYYEDGNCVAVYSDYINVYDKVPTRNSSGTGIRYYFNSHYLSQKFNYTMGSNAILPICYSKSLITTEPYYRNDFPDILIIFVIMSFISFWVPWKIFCRLFRRFN